MTSPDEVASFFDVDNTLLDNDRIEKYRQRHMEHEFGAGSRDRYFAILEELRAELGYADYLGALQQLAAQLQREGAESFDKFWNDLMDTIASKSQVLGKTTQAEGKR